MNLHAIGITVAAVEEELRINPHRIEEKRSVFGSELTPLIAAAIDGNFPVVRFLAENGANINAKTNGGYTALMQLCAYRGTTEAIGLMLGIGADIEEKNNNGDTALMLAVSNRRKDVALFLVSCGADINAQNKDGENSLSLARHRWNDTGRSLQDAFDEAQTAYVMK